MLYEDGDCQMHFRMSAGHEADKVIYCNNHTKRIDLLRQIDGLFDEFTYAGTALNTTALLGIGKPVIGWSTNDYIRLAPDAFIQKFIYMGVHPIVPFPGNDHSLQPDAKIERYYMDYAPIMELMRGRSWVLTPHAIRVTEGIARQTCSKPRTAISFPSCWEAPQRKQR